MSTSSKGELHRRLAESERVRVIQAEHLKQMGLHMQAMLEAHFNVLKLARESYKGLNLLVFLGANKTAGVRRALGEICGLTGPYAAEHRTISDPRFALDEKVADEIRHAGDAAAERGDGEEMGA